MIKRRVWTASAIVAVMTALDLGTKEWARARLVDPGATGWARAASVDARKIEVIGGFWDFRYAENRDVGFSLLSGIPHDIRQPLIFALVCLGIVAISVYGYQRLGSTRAMVGSALILSGALGNLVDRATRGFVTDFVHWYLGTFSWPIFNVADVSVVLGVGLLLLHEWRAGKVDPTLEASAPNRVES